MYSAPLWESTATKASPRGQVRVRAWRRWEDSPNTGPAVSAGFTGTESQLPTFLIDFLFHKWKVRSDARVPIFELDMIKAVIWNDCVFILNFFFPVGKFWLVKLNFYSFHAKVCRSCDQLNSIIYVNSNK